MQKKIDKAKEARRRMALEEHPLAPLLVTTIETDQGETQANVTDALYAIARAADGSMRDSQSILEQLISYGGEQITFQDVFDVLGLVDWQVLHTLCEAILDKDIARLLRIVEDIVVSGKDLSQLVQDILRYFRNLLVCKTADPNGLLALPDDEIAAMQTHATRFSLTGLIRLVGSIPQRRRK